MLSASENKSIPPTSNNFLERGLSVSEAEGMVEPHAAVTRRPGHGGLGVVVKAEAEGVGIGDKTLLCKVNHRS